MGHNKGRAPPHRSAHVWTWPVLQATSTFYVVQKRSRQDATDAGGLKCGIVRFWSVLQHPNQAPGVRPSPNLIVQETFLPPPGRALYTTLNLKGLLDNNCGHL
jgi:hypothetical protein